MTTTSLIFMASISLSPYSPYIENHQETQLYDRFHNIQADSRCFRNEIDREFLTPKVEKSKNEEIINRLEITNSIKASIQKEILDILKVF